MSDIIGGLHNWTRGETLQWGGRGLPYEIAQTPYKCEKCGKSFTHFYHQEPDIYEAMEQQGINPDSCP